MKIRPHHVGISVANMQESIEWYQSNLGFKFVWLKEFPEIKTHIAFLQNGDFQIELFEHFDTIPLSEYRKQVLTDIQTQGTKHICFVVENGLEKLFENFKAIGVTIAMGPVMSPPKDALMGFIRDPTGNLIEIIQLF